jgi:hypothetical protein
MARAGAYAEKLHATLCTCGAFKRQVHPHSGFFGYEKTGDFMSKNIATVVLAATMAVATIIPAAHAGDHRGHRDHYAYNGGHRHGGHWHNGQWIALGILGAAVGAAVADSEYRHCWYEYGRRYCD